MTSVATPLVSTAVHARRRLRVEAVTDMAGLSALQADWNALVERSGAAHPFLTHEWVSTWWEAFGAGRQLHVLLVRDGSELVGIAPLMIGRSSLAGWPVRALDSLANDHSPRFEFILGARPLEACQAIWRTLRAQGGWDVLRLREVPDGSPTLAGLQAAIDEDASLLGLWPSAQSPYVKLDGTWEDYLQTLPASQRKSQRKRLRRLRGAGKVEHEIVTGRAGLSQAVEDALRLEAAGWKGAEGTAIAARPELRLFYSLLASRSAERGTLRLSFLSLDGRRIAFSYCLLWDGRLFSLKSGYDPEFSPYSPSNLLLELKVRRAFEEGYSEVDLLGGREEWKERWTREARAHHWLFAAPSGPVMRLLFGAKFRLLPLLQQRSSFRALRAAAFRLRRSGLPAVHSRRNQT